MSKILMIGDSTMQFNNIFRYPQTGWGQVLNMFTKPEVCVLDYGKNGRSTKSYIDEGRFEKVLQKVEKGDFVICQFGHNDEKVQDPSRYTTKDGTYLANLKYFNDAITKKGATMVCATSICRRQFDDEGHVLDTHKGYPEAMLSWCEKEGVTCIDLNKATMNLYNKLGEEETKKFHMMFPKDTYENYPDGKDDTTHLRYEGALMVSYLFVRGLFNTDSKLKDLFLNLDEKEEIDWQMLID